MCFTKILYCLNYFFIRCYKYYSVSVLYRLVLWLKINPTNLLCQYQIKTPPEWVCQKSLVLSQLLLHQPLVLGVFILYHQRWHCCIVRLGTRFKFWVVLSFRSCGDFILPSLPLLLLPGMYELLLLELLLLLRWLHITVLSQPRDETGNTKRKPKNKFSIWTVQNTCCKKERYFLTRIRIERKGAEVQVPHPLNLSGSLRLNWANETKMWQKNSQNFWTKSA